MDILFWSVLSSSLKADKLASHTNFLKYIGISRRDIQTFLEIFGLRTFFNEKRLENPFEKDSYLSLYK